MSQLFKNVKFLEKMPTRSQISGQDTLLIFDKRLCKIRWFNAWIQNFPNRYAVSAGEKLKELESFPVHFERLAKKLEGTGRNLKIIAVGGGSVTDFAGFFASTYKRGVSLTLIPSTWLAAIDSAHGGKTGLNSLRHKNALGTFYFADKIFIVKQLLISQPRAREAEAFGELIKISLICGKPWTKRLFTDKSIKIWKYLRLAIAAKYEVIKRDPFEIQGVRQILNLGHTLGHVLEKKCGIPHGMAVGQGLIFASKWSERKGLINKSWLERVEALIARTQGQKSQVKLSRHALLEGLGGDKKIVGKKIEFIFLREPGKVVVQSVSPGEITKEAEAQGWIA